MFPKTFYMHCFMFAIISSSRVMHLRNGDGPYFRCCLNTQMRSQQPISDQLLQFVCCIKFLHTSSLVALKIRWKHRSLRSSMVFAPTDVLKNTC